MDKGLGRLPLYSGSLCECSESSRTIEEKGGAFSRVVVVTGIPGTGKTTLAKGLSSIVKAKVIQLTGFALDRDLILSYDKRRNTSVIDEKRLAENLCSFVRECTCSIILEGHHVSHVVPRQVRIVLVLRCHPHELHERLRRRGYQISKIRENLEAEILDVCLIDAVEWFGKELVCEIDTTGRPASQVVEEACDILSGVRPRVIGQVDWLSDLKLEGMPSFFLGSGMRRQRKPT